MSFKTQQRSTDGYYTLEGGGEDVPAFEVFISPGRPNVLEYIIYKENIDIALLRQNIAYLSHSKT